LGRLKCLGKNTCPFFSKWAIVPMAEHVSAMIDFSPHIRPGKYTSFGAVTEFERKIG
jgi:hypothetical protein